MIAHHLDDATLMSCAAGTLPAAARLAFAVAMSPEPHFTAKTAGETNKRTTGHRRQRVSWDLSEQSLTNSQNEPRA